MQVDDDLEEDTQRNAGLDIFIRPTAEHVAREHAWDMEENDNAIASQIGYDTCLISVDINESFEVPTGHEGVVSDRDQDEHEERPDYVPLADADGKVWEDVDARGYCLFPGRYLYDGATLRVIEHYPEEEYEDDF